MHLKNGKTVQLATEAVPSVTVGSQQNSNTAVGISNLQYRLMSSWEYPGYVDVYLIDVQTGKRRRVFKKLQGRLRLSPSGNHLVWFDGQKQTWMGMDVRTRKSPISRRTFPIRYMTNSTTARFPRQRTVLPAG